MRALALTLALATPLAACGGAAMTPGHPAAPIEPAALSFDDPVGAARRMVALAHKGQPGHRQLQAHVDWPWVRRLAPVSGAFQPTLDDLVATLTAAPPAGCAPEWQVDDGGHRLDFPPAMVDDPDDLAAEKDALKAELYTGHDVVFTCGPQAEQFALQLVRGPRGAWLIRGWTPLAPVRAWLLGPGG